MAGICAGREGGQAHRLCASPFLLKIGLARHLLYFRPSPAAPFHSSMHSPAKTKMHGERQGEGRPRVIAGRAPSPRGAIISPGSFGNKSELCYKDTTNRNFANFLSQTEALPRGFAARHSGVAPR